MALVERVPCQAICSRGGSRPRGAVRPCGFDRATGARRHGPSERGRDRERTVLRVCGARRIAARRRDAPASCVRRRIPLLRGLARLGLSVSPLLRGDGIAGRIERLVLFAVLLAPVTFVFLPSRAALVVG